MLKIDWTNCIILQFNLFSLNIFTTYLPWKLHQNYKTDIDSWKKKSNAISLEKISFMLLNFLEIDK